MHSNRFDFYLIKLKCDDIRIESLLTKYVDKLILAIISNTNNNHHTHQLKSNRNRLIITHKTTDVQWLVWPIVCQLTFCSDINLDRLTNATNRPRNFNYSTINSGQHTITPSTDWVWWHCKWSLLLVDGVRYS